MEIKVRSQDAFHIERRFTDAEVMASELPCLLKEKNQSKEPVNYLRDALKKSL